MTRAHRGTHVVVAGTLVGGLSTARCTWCDLWRTERSPVV
ncbi:hypothetical protein GJR88_01541 [Dietzia sp. DQ12-45-1b]|nr:hypothetical protein GJR88_01541 [Dietzia sp. DQ12-45-1b]